jgi:hypothetical protein
MAGGFKKARFNTDKDDDFLLWLLLLKECLICSDDDCIVIDCDDEGNDLPVITETP